MHPAFSILLFSTLSGAGYGVWLWLGLLQLASVPLPRTASLIVLGLGFVLVSGGLMGSLLHLGQPQRAWRAFSQWRSSWLSREGVAAVLGFLPMLWLGAALWFGYETRIAGLLLALMAAVTVLCTAMIYASLKPIPAWQHPLVVPIYLLFSWLTGGLLLAAVFALAGSALGEMVGLGTLLLAMVLWRLKRQTWRWIDMGRSPVTRQSALGLPGERDVRVFERPHTEANYLNKEMGFVLARKHSRRLRVIAVAMFALIPALCALPVWFLVQLQPAPWLAVAAASALLGALVERWLFFAEARHVVNLYY